QEARLRDALRPGELALRALRAVLRRHPVRAGSAARRHARRRRPRLTGGRVTAPSAADGTVGPVAPAGQPRYTDPHRGRKEDDMAIKVGDTLPTDIKLKEMGDGGPKDVTVGEIFKGKRVVVFAVPGAFTPTCSMKHLPGFLEQ